MNPLTLFTKPSSDDGSCATRLAIGVGLLMVGVLGAVIIIIPAAGMNPAILQQVAGIECRPKGEADQVDPSGYAEDSIPGNYLKLYREAGKASGIPWNVIAGIGQVESHHGRWDGPGVTEGHNDWGAAGPMMFGAKPGSAAGNSWGGEPVMPVEERPEKGYGKDGDGDGTVSVYDPGDAIPAAADYLIAHGAPDDMKNAIFGYNHAWWYVEDVLGWAEQYADGDFSVGDSIERGVECDTNRDGDPIGDAPTELAQQVVDWALAQRGKPYIWGGTGPAGYDCSGLTYKAYASIGVSIPRVSQDQWSFGPEIEAGTEQPGDLIFFDVQRAGEPEGPGHMAMVVGDGMMVEAWCTDCGPITTRSYEDRDILGFTRPFENPKVKEQLEEMGKI